MILFCNMGRIEKLEAFLKDNPNDCFLKHALALEYIKGENIDKAQMLFEENLRFNPDYLATYYHLGKLLEEKRETKESIKMYKKGMELANQQNDAHSYHELVAAYNLLTN